MQDIYAVDRLTKLQFISSNDASKKPQATQRCLNHAATTNTAPSGAEFGVARPLGTLTLSLREKILFGIAFSLAAITTLLLVTAELYGQAGALIPGTILSTPVISFIGARHRIIFTAIATGRPVILVYADAIHDGAFEPGPGVFMDHVGGIGSSNNEKRTRLSRRSTRSFETILGP